MSVLAVTRKSNRPSGCFATVNGFVISLRSPSPCTFMVCEPAFTLRNIGAVLPEPDFIWKRLRMTSNCPVSALSMPLPNVLLQSEHSKRCCDPTFFEGDEQVNVG